MRLDWSVLHLYTGLDGLRACRVHHLLAPLYPPSSFPSFAGIVADNALGGLGWDAIQVVNGNQSASAVFVFRAQLGDDAITVVPRGLAVATVYTVAATDAGWSLQGTGAQLMTAGFNVTLSPATSEVVVITTL